MTDTDYPALYRAADKLSNRAQTHFFKVLFANLFLLFCAAALSIIDGPAVVIALIQAIVLLLSLACAVYLGLMRPEKVWYGGRALAESVKTISWRYMMRAEPYNISDKDARVLFIDVLIKLVATNVDISRQMVQAATGAQVTDYMVARRESSFAHRKALYRDRRITEQCDWYQQKAQANERAATRYFIALCVANLAGVVFALLKIAFPNAEFWPTDVIITLAGGILAWTQAKRYRELSASYALTANEISLIREQLFKIISEVKFSEFVGDAENAFSREHTQWLARRDG